MVRDVKTNMIYRINTNSPCFADLYVGDLVIVESVDGRDLVVRLIEGGDTWFIDMRHIDSYCINKGKGVDNYGC